MKVSGGIWMRLLSGRQFLILRNGITNCGIKYLITWKFSQGSMNTRIWTSLLIQLYCCWFWYFWGFFGRGITNLVIVYFFITWVSVHLISAYVAFVLVVTWVCLFVCIKLLKYFIGDWYFQKSYFLLWLMWDFKHVVITCACSFFLRKPRQEPYLSGYIFNSVISSGSPPMKNIWQKKGISSKF